MRIRAAGVLLGIGLSACAARGHLATPDEVERLREAQGLSASGRITLSGRQGRFSAGVILGVARPDRVRIEIPAGAGLRFLLVAKDGRLRAELPGDDAMFEGPGTAEVMNRLFGIDLEPKDLVSALLGSPPESLSVGWRFDRSGPVQVTIRGSNTTKLALTLDDTETESPAAQAFDFGPPRRYRWTLPEMSERLGLRR